MAALSLLDAAQIMNLFETRSFSPKGVYCVRGGKKGDICCCFDVQLTGSVLHGWSLEGLELAKMVLLVFDLGLSACYD